MLYIDHLNEVNNDVKKNNPTDDYVLQQQIDNFNAQQIVGGGSLDDNLKLQLINKEDTSSNDNKLSLLVGGDRDAIKILFENIINKYNEFNQELLNSNFLSSLIDFKPVLIQLEY